MNKNKSPVWKIVILIIEAFAEIISALMLITNAFSKNDSEALVVKSDQLYSGICIWLFLFVTLCGFAQLKSGKRYVLLPGLVTKIIMAALFAGALILKGTSLLPVAVGVNIAILIVFFVTSRKSGTENEEDSEEKKEGQHAETDTVSEKNKSVSVSSPYTEMPVNEESAFRLSWIVDRATHEYCTANSKIRDKLTPADNKEINKFGCVPISYLFAWLVKHDYCSGYFTGKYDLNWIKTENADPSVFIANELDGIINYSAFSDKIRKFMDFYYDPSEHFISGSGHTFYQDDYYAVIRNPWRVFFNIDFSWDLYHKLENKIDERYEYFMRDQEWNSSEIYNKNRISGQIYSDRLGKYFDLYVAPGVSEEYVMSCTQQLKNLSDEMYEKLYQKIYYAFIEPFRSIRSDYKDEDMVFESLESASIAIPKPHGEDPAYILGFDTDFAREHGIAVTVRGEEIIDASFRMDADSPWCSINELNFRLEKSLKNINAESIDAISKALLEYSKGNLEQTVLIPSFVRMPVPEENRLFVPAPAFELKNRYDIIAEKMLSEGSADRYECKPGYKEGSIIPSYIRICLFKSGTPVFSESIQIW